jgi:hypothetical protein
VALSDLGLNYPLDIRRRIDRKWQQRPVPSPAPARARPRIAPPACPHCHAPAPRVPAVSTRLADGSVHHRWVCAACGGAWTKAGGLPA